MFLWQTSEQIFRLSIVDELERVSLKDFMG